MLTPMQFERLSVTSPYQLPKKHYAGTLARVRLAGLSVWAEEAARHRDKVARDILRDARRHLASFGEPVIALIFPRPDETARVAGELKFMVCNSGGVFQNEFVLASFTESVSIYDRRAEIRRALLPLVLSSLLPTYHSAGIEFPRHIVNSWTKFIV